VHLLVEAQLRGYGNVHAQNNGYSRIRLIYEVFLHGFKVGVWPAMSATKYIGPDFRSP
jgi:hypothetical protein